MRLLSLLYQRHSQKINNKRDDTRCEACLHQRAVFVLKERGDSAHSEEAVDKASKPGAGGAAGIGAGTGAL